MRITGLIKYVINRILMLPLRLIMYQWHARRRRAGPPPHRGRSPKAYEGIKLKIYLLLRT